MTVSDLQSQCQLGQEALEKTEYFRSASILAAAEAEALAGRDFDTLARLYLPLQEARRQIRQRCAEGVVCLDLIAQGERDDIDGRRIIENYPHGQLLVAGWKSIEPAVVARRLREEHALYVETFLGAVYPIGNKRVVAILPLEDAKLPTTDISSVEKLVAALPAHSIVLEEGELPSGPQKGDEQLRARVMELWERLHRPFLESADAQSDAMQKIEGYRQTIRVDYACELAHQKLSDVAKELGRIPSPSGRGSG